MFEITPGCGEIARVNGLLALCSKETGHEKSEDPAEREHHDPSVDRRWLDEDADEVCGVSYDHDLREYDTECRRCGAEMPLPDAWEI